MRQLLLGPLLRRARSPRHSNLLRAFLSLREQNDSAHYSTDNKSRAREKLLLISGCLLGKEVRFDGGLMLLGC